MKHLIMFTLCLMIAVTANASGDYQSMTKCERYAEYALIVMYGRQNGVPYSDVSSSATSPATSALINVAYRERIRVSVEAKQRAIDDFKDGAYMACQNG